MWTEGRRSRSLQSPFEARKRAKNIYLKDTGLEGLDWIKLAQNSDQERNCVETVKNLDVLRAPGTSWLRHYQLWKMKMKASKKGRCQFRDATQDTSEYF